jgi:hypothetical protein
MGLRAESMEITLSLTTKCNASCSYCERKQLWTPKNIQMPLEVVRKLPKCDRVSFTSACGDAIFHDDLFKIIEIIGNKNPYVHIRFTTNGSIGSQGWWEYLATILGKHSLVGFCIDSLDRICPYRKLLVPQQMKRMLWYKKINDNMYWQFIKFDWNKNQIKKAKNLAKVFEIDLIVKQNRITAKVPEVTKCRCFDDHWYYICEDCRIHPCCYFATYFAFDHKQTDKVYEDLNEEIYSAFLESRDLIDLTKNDFETAINSPYFETVAKYNRRVDLCQKCQPKNYMTLS